MIRIGQHYKEIVSDGEIYILAQVFVGQVALIGMMDGNRWNEPILVGNVRDISPDEWAQVTESSDFQEVIVEFPKKRFNKKQEKEAYKVIVSDLKEILDA